MFIDKNNSIAFYCTDNISSALFLTYSIINITVLFPISVIVFGLAVRKFRMTSSNKTFMSHCDVLCHHQAAIEMIGTMGIVIYMAGLHLYNTVAVTVGFIFLGSPGLGQMVFAVMTCLDRYLAVVHPFHYLRLRRQPWINIRNIIIGVTWVLSFSVTGYSVFLQDPTATFIPSLIMFTFCFLGVLFFSSSILLVLIRPKPGDVSEHQSWLHKSKKKAFYTVAIIMAVQLFRFGAYLLSIVLTYSNTVGTSVLCLVNISTYWFDLPSSLVLPLLFLHKEHKLLRSKFKKKEARH